MKNKRTLLFAGILAAFLMLAVPFAVVAFDADDADAAAIEISESSTTKLTSGDYILKGKFNSIKVLEIDSGASEKTISITAENGVVLKGLYIKGNTTATGMSIEITGLESTVSGIIVSKVKNVTITDCYVHNVTSSHDYSKIAGNIVGIGVDEISGNVVISNNMVTDVTNAGIIAHSSISNVKIQNNEIINVGFNGLWVKNKGNTHVTAILEISNNSIVGWGTSEEGRAIRTNNVAAVTITDNDFSKDYTSGVVDVGNLFKTDFKDVTGNPECTVIFESNWFNDELIPINVSDKIGATEGIFFDAGSIFVDDSKSTVTIENGSYYWYNVVVDGHCVFPNGVTDKDANINVYGELNIGSEAKLTAININLTEESRLNNEGNLIFEQMSVSEGAGAYYMAGSKVTTDRQTVTYRQDEKYDPATGGAQAAITIYLEGVNVYLYESEIDVFVGDLYVDSLPDISVESGYKFDGWYTEFGVEITDTTQASADVTRLIAKAVYDPTYDENPFFGVPETEESEFDIADHIVLIEIVVAVIALIGFVAYIRKN